MRCGYCREAGHNRKTCPKMKDMIQSTLQENPNDYHANRLAQRYYSNKTKQQRRCGYCSELGHARNKCEVIESDINNMKSYYQNIYDNQDKISDYIRPYIGKGDLVYHVNYSYDFTEKTYVARKEPCIVSHYFLDVSRAGCSGHSSENLRVQLNPIAPKSGDFKPYYVPLSKLLQAEVVPSLEVQEQSLRYLQAYVIKSSESGQKTLNFSSDNWTGKTDKELFLGSCYGSSGRRNYQCVELERSTETNRLSITNSFWREELRKSDYRNFYKN